MTSLAQSYAKALQIVAGAEGSYDKTKEEMLAISELLRTNTELRSAVTDRLVPSASRFQLISDALGGKVSDLTNTLVAMIAGAGRGGNFEDIVAAFVSGQVGGTQIATVRSAVALSEDQKARLAQQLKSSIGSEVQIQNIVDPDVVGGLVTTIGDRVIDGTVRTRLERMKSSI